MSLQQLKFRGCVGLLTLMAAVTAFADTPQASEPANDSESKQPVASDTSEADASSDTSASGSISSPIVTPVTPPANFNQEVRPPSLPEDAKWDGIPPSKKAQPIRLSSSMERRRQRVQNALKVYAAQRISTTKRSPWGLMHAMIPFGVDARILANGRDMNAVSWLCSNGNGRNLRLFYTRDEELRIRVGPGLQGHEGQFLAMMAQSRVSSKMPLSVEDQKFTVQDLIDYEKSTCKDGTELTFKLIGLVHYLPCDATWETADGETFDFPRLIREELKQSIVGAACGGTHRLMGYSYAVRQRRERGGAMTGEWKRAEETVNRYLVQSQRLRNRDGSYSTDWYKARGMDRDLDRRVQTTGHILEWVVFSSPQRRLYDADITGSVDYLTSLLVRRQREELEVGPRGHAIRALALYNDRVFVDPPATFAGSQNVAQKQGDDRKIGDRDLR